MVTFASFETLFSASFTVYFIAVGFPTKVDKGVKVIVPVDAFTCQVPSAGTIS
jgi:hypothetical protein